MRVLAGQAVWDNFLTNMLAYSDIGPWSKWGLWGSLQSVTQDPATSPKYRG